MLRAVFFDMDDTVLAPKGFNPWARFKESHGLPQGLLILDGIALQPHERRAELLEALHRYELEQIEASELRGGMAELLAELRALGVATALLTNNHRRATEVALRRHGLEFSLVLTRDEATPKPAPDLLLAALGHFGLEAQQALYVGDSEGDLQACNAVGVPVWFLATPHNLQFSPRFEYTDHLREALLPRIVDRAGV
ncbi:MAG: HAD-IA family hydrolase [Meiothermus sp.]|nr:HAD-IA family hydrolase [Meiothermus sp.]